MGWIYGMRWLAHDKNPEAHRENRWEGGGGGGGGGVIVWNRAHMLVRPPPLRFGIFPRIQCPPSFHPSRDEPGA